MRCGDTRNNNNTLNNAQLPMIETHLVFRFKALVPLVMHLLHMVSETGGCNGLHAVCDCMDYRTNWLKYIHMQMRAHTH